MRDERINFNNPIIKHKFSTDPSVLIEGEQVYLYTGHDEVKEGVSEYTMNEWLCFSSNDMVDWEEHPIPLKAEDFKWAKGDAFGSKVIAHGGRYYWYVAVTHGTIKGTAIGVAVADSPTGPFSDAKGDALISREMLPGSPIAMANLDPSVLVDDDGQGYIFWGKSVCYFARLKSNMIELDGPILTIELPEFAEGAHIHKRNGLYYLCYGYASPEKVAYAMSDNINGPWNFSGIVNELAGNCETNRPGIVNFKGRDYFFYHNGGLKSGGSHRRSVCIDYLYYNEDGTIKTVVMTGKGVSPAD